MKNHIDAQLVRKHLNGDEKALPSLIKRYLKPVYNFVYRYVGNTQDAEDVTQEVFVKMWRNLKEFDPQRNCLATLRDKQNKNLAPYRTEGSGSGFKTWIFEIAKNASLNWIKKKRPYLFSQFENGDGENSLAEFISDRSPLPEELFAQTEFDDKLAAAVEKLNPDYRKVFILRYNNDLAFKDISESLNKPLNTVKSRYRRSLLMLKKFLDY